MSVLPPFEHRRPSSLAEATSLVGLDDVPYAGGTELLLAMRAGLYRPSSLVDLKRLPELAIIERDGDSLVIGGAVTHQGAIDSPIVRDAVPIIPVVLRTVGNPRVRASGTLGGNLCFAEPKSDVGTLLIALESSVRLRSVEADRSIPLSDFFEGAYATVRRDDEILESISTPIRPDTRVVYEKFATMERPTAAVAMSIAPSGGVRIVVGAAGPTPHLVEVDALSEVDAEAVADAIEVLPDVAGSDRYKRHIVSLLVDRLVARLEERS